MRERKNIETAGSSPSRRAKGESPPRANGKSPKAKAVARSTDGNSTFPSTGRTPLGVRFLEAKPSLSSSRQRLVRQILDESNETFFLSSREMGRRYNVNTATIIRTIQALGYEKFADFAHDLREYFVTGITPYSAMKTAEEIEQSVADRVRQSVEKDVSNVREFQAGLDADKIVEIANRINLSNRIVVLGIDYAASLAGSLAYGLVRLGYDADAPVGSSGIVQSRIKIMTPKDLLIAISFGRGLRDTIEAVQSARRHNVPSFGITNGDATPIAKYCDTFLTTTIARTSFIDSYVAPVAAINAILVACAHIQSERSLEHLRESEEEYASGTRWFNDGQDR
ncbi:MAG: MurR/RpiR family transcriptional regulator [Pyrinomonadaceae bacterium]